MNSTLSSIVVHQGLAFASDTDGWLHCVDAKTGEGRWVHDTKAYPMSSPLIVGDRVYFAADSTVFIFRLTRGKHLIAEHDFPSFIEASPMFCNKTLYVMTRSQLYAIGPERLQR